MSTNINQGGNNKTPEPDFAITMGGSSGGHKGNPYVSHFVVEKKISIAFIITIVVQIFFGGWWAARATAELEAIKEKLVEAAANRYTKTEARLELGNLNRRIDNLEEKTDSIDARVRTIEINMANHRGRER